MESIPRKEWCQTLGKFCQNDCNFRFNYEGGTMMGNEGQGFDKHGELHGWDPNYSTWNVYCRTCSREWELKTHDTKMSFKELKDG